MKRAIGNAVAIGEIDAGDGSEAIEIEMGIFQFERIESPLDKMNAIAESILALSELEAAAYAAILILRENGGHVRVEEREATSKSCKGHSKADHLIAVEGAVSESTGVFADNEYGGGDKDVSSPGEMLEADAFIEFGERVEGTDSDLVGH